MATVNPVDEFVTEEWYPGFKPAYDHAPWIVDPVNTFQKKDEETFWFLDFHWPRGMTPMGMIWNEDGYNWGTQLAAESLPLPPGRGITTRFAGTHIYASSIPVMRMIRSSDGRAAVSLSEQPDRLAYPATRASTPRPAASQKVSSARFIVTGPSWLSTTSRRYA